MQHYLSIAAIYFDEAPYLREWVAFHKLVGVEKFFLYDNGNTDSHLEELAPFLDDGTVTLHDWKVFPGQHPAYEHALRHHRRDSRWIAFLDLDEFLFSPTFKPLPEILVDYEQYPAVTAAWVMFGTSGHRTRPPGLTLETHDHRKEFAEFEIVKSIVDPTRTEHVLSPHAFTYKDGALAVNENHVPIEGPRWGMTEFSVERLRINHYSHRSEEEYVKKLSRPTAMDGKPKPFPEGSLERRIRRSNAVFDDTISHYLPALKETLAKLDDAPAELGAR